MSDSCEECENGYLINQEYGFADIPDGWTPIQRCDNCSRYEGDGDAAEAAAKAKGNVAVAFFLAEPDEDDGEDIPGDYAIEWSEGPDNDDWINRAYQRGACGNERTSA